MEPRRSREPKRRGWKAAGKGGVWGDRPGPRAWLDHSPQSVFADLRRPRGGGRRERGVQLQSFLEASRPALMGFPEAPGRLGGVGSVSAPPARERLAGGTLRFPRSFRERSVGPYCVSSAVLGAQRGPKWAGPACP